MKINAISRSADILGKTYSLTQQIWLRANRHCPVSKMKILWVLLSRIIFLHILYTFKFQPTNFLQLKTWKTSILQNEVHKLHNISDLCAMSISICLLEQQYLSQLQQIIHTFLFLHDDPCHSRCLWHWYCYANPCTLYYMITQGCTVPNISSKVQRELHSTTKWDNITNASLLQLKADGETSVVQNKHILFK
jgi:hypothetical protein